MRIDIDQKWRRKEDGSMELIEEIEVEREIEPPTKAEILEQELANTNALVLELTELIMGGM